MSSSPYSNSNPKINPALKRRPDGSPDDNDRVEIGPTALAFAEWEAAGLAVPNLSRMREWRLSRICGELQKQDCAGLLLFDPLNIRYATDSSNMQVWTLHNFARAAFISADGYIVLWDYRYCDHMTEHLPLIKEKRFGASFFYFVTGDMTVDAASDFAKEIDALLRRHGGDNRRLAVDKIEIAGVHALEKHGIQITSGQFICEQARAIKNTDEINAMRCSIKTCEIAMQVMEDALQPGMTENELWAILHYENIKRGGEWIETRILNSGPRSNPWMQECGPRVIQAGDIVAFDTDLVGPYGMCADLSRTWVCGDDRASDAQRKIYQVAYEHIQTNRELLTPGTPMRDLTFNGHMLPEKYVEQRYSVKFHGIGLCDEYPSIFYPEDFIQGAFEYELQPGMTLCVEAYIGAVGEREGVKLEDIVLVTEKGYENLSQFHFDERLLKI